MAKDVKDAGDVIGAALGAITREISNVGADGHGGPFKGKGDGVLAGPRGIAAGAVLATAAPVASKAVRKLVLRRIGQVGASKGKGMTEKLSEGAKQTVGKGLKGGGDSKDKKGAPGVGKGRRMPVQQSVDIGVPLAVAYNQWTQFEEWPQFMHRLDQVTQKDDCTVAFKVKIWGMSKEFDAQIVEQRPEERIQWSVAKGVTHQGVVTFHELAPRLTRVQVSLDVEPGSWVEKAARGMRHVKRAVRADLARFKAFIEMQEAETGAWRGEIRDGKVVKARERKSSSGSSKRSTTRKSSERSRSKKRSRSGSSRKRGSTHA